MTIFFTSNINKFKEYLDKNKPNDEHWNDVSHAASSLHFENTEQSKINKFFIYLVIKFIYDHPEEWDKYAAKNAEWIGKQLLDTLDGSIDKGENYILYLVFRFMYEYYLTCGYEIDNLYIALINYYLSDQFEIPNSIEREFNYAIKAMPLSILRGIFSPALNKKLSTVDELANKTNTSLKKIEDFDSTWDEKLLAREIKINTLDEKLKKYEQGFNFVGLFDGFSNLKKSKVTELEDASQNAKNWKTITIFIPILSFLTLIFVSYFPTQSKIEIIHLMIPLTTLLVLSLYFYRIAFSLQKSIKSQLLQIDLRMTLCQFIQSYADYSADLKSKNDHTLQKFEEIIFSGLVSEDANLPTTLDGVEQIGKLIQSIKK